MGQSGGCRCQQHCSKEGSRVHQDMMWAADRHVWPCIARKQPREVGPLSPGNKQQSQRPARPHGPPAWCAVFPRAGRVERVFTGQMRAQRGWKVKVLMPRVTQLRMWVHSRSQTLRGEMCQDPGGWGFRELDGHSVSPATGSRVNRPHPLPGMVTQSGDEGLHAALLRTVPK